MKLYVYPTEVNWINWNGESKMAYCNTNKLFTGIMIDGIKSICTIKDGLIHNLSGPARISSDGELKYYVNGKYIGKTLSNKEFNKKIKEMIFSS